MLLVLYLVAALLIGGAPIAVAAAGPAAGFFEDLEESLGLLKGQGGEEGASSAPAGAGGGKAAGGAGGTGPGKAGGDASVSSPANGKRKGNGAGKPKLKPGTR